MSKGYKEDGHVRVNKGTHLHVSRTTHLYGYDKREKREKEQLLENHRSSRETI